MADLRTQFRGLNTEVHPHHLPSGTADRAVNVVIGPQGLARRMGVDQYEDDVKGSSTADSILNVWTASFANGSVYVLAKCGATLYRRQLHPTAAATFTAITGGWAGATGERGWGFVWADRFYWGDTHGINKWHPIKNAGVAYKAGLPLPSTGLTVSAIADTAGVCGMAGSYRAAYALMNYATGEEGVISNQNQTAIVCSVGTLAFGITNFYTAGNPPTGISQLYTAYEWDRAVLYRTEGHTEKIGAANTYSFRLFRDWAVPRNLAANPALVKADHVLDKQEFARNSGGEPPGAGIGCFDGNGRAVYGQVHDGTYATYEFDPTGDNNGLLFTAKTAGSAGNNVTIGVTVSDAEAILIVDEQVDPLPAAATAGPNIVIWINSGVSTANSIIALFNAYAPAVALASIELLPNDAVGNTGAGTISTGLASLTHFTGGGEMVGGALTPARVYYSLPTFPAMVPRDVMYSLVGDYREFAPKPWRGRMDVGMTGHIVALAAGGNTILALGETTMHELVPAGDGRLIPVLRHPSVGACGKAAACGAPGAIYAFGRKSIIKARSGAWRDLAEQRLGPTLDELPEAARADIVAAHYGYEGQVWFALPHVGGTKNQRVLIYDETLDDFYTFDLACLGTRATLATAFSGANNDLTFTAEKPGVLGNSIYVTIQAGGTAGQETVTVTGNEIVLTVSIGSTTAAQVLAAWNLSGDAAALAACALTSGNDGTGLVAALSRTALASGASDEGITAMCECAVPDAAPVMLLATDKGRILQYPGTTALDSGAAYAARWRGYFNQERVGSEHQLDGLTVHTGTSVSGNVRVGCRALQTAKEDVPQVAALMQKSTGVEHPSAWFDRTFGNLFQLEFFSPQSVVAQWKVEDLVLDLKKPASA